MLSPCCIAYVFLSFFGVKCIAVCFLMNILLTDLYTSGMGVSRLGSIILYCDPYQQIGRDRETTSSQAPVGRISIHGHRWQ